MKHVLMSDKEPTDAELQQLMLEVVREAKRKATLGQEYLKDLISLRISELKAVSNFSE